MSMKRNTIIAVAVLAVFIVSISIARLSMASPIESQTTSGEAVGEVIQEETTEVSADYEIVTLREITTELQSESFALTSAMENEELENQTYTSTAASQVPTPGGTRFFIDYNNISSKTLAAFDQSGTRYLATVFPYAVIDRETNASFHAYSLDVFSPLVTNYNLSTETSTAMQGTVRWLLKKSVPYLSIEDARTALLSTGFGQASQLTYEDIYYATQMAIWNQTNGITQWIFNAGYIDSDYPLVPSLYAHLISTMQSDTTPVPTTSITVSPSESLVLKKNLLGPFDLKGVNLTADATNTPFTISLTSDKSGINMQIVDQNQLPITTVMPNTKFYILISNYSDLPKNTTYSITATASAQNNITIQGEGLLMSPDQPSNKLPSAKTGYPIAYAASSQLQPYRTRFTFNFTTSKQEK